MTDLLFRENAYLRETTGRVVGHTPEGGIILAGTIFYPTGGGQPGDSGNLIWDKGTLKIATAVKADTAGIALVPAEPMGLPAIGTDVIQQLDWERRHRHMRVHTALHLLSVIIPLPVTGGSIGIEKGRLDFDMPESPTDKQALEDQLNELILRDFVVSEDWITEAHLQENPDLIKTMSVTPPKGSGRIRMVRIGQGDEQVDWQPCGGTHVERTGEIGRVRLGKIEKKGRQNRRVNLHLDG
ncbi:MAG: alanyl-tRNA editing protein [Cognatishimia sp.]